MIDLACFAGAFGEGDVAGFREWRVGVFGDEVEHAAEDAGDGFVVAVGNSDEAEVIALAEEGFSGSHVASGGDAVAGEGEEEEEDEREGEDGECAEGIHDRPASKEDLEEVEGLCWRC